MAVQQPLWKKLEDEFLIEYGQEGVIFTVEHVAYTLDVTTKQASRFIQSYWDACRRNRIDPGGGPMFTLYRRPGTRGSIAEWYVGNKAVDMRRIGRTLVDDVNCKVRRDFEPALREAAKRNPHAARKAARMLDVMMNAIMPLLSEAFD